MPALDRLRRIALRILFHDDGGAATPTVFVGGVARSGTTWLAELLAAAAPARIMFEPFHARRVPGFAEFEYHQYMRPGTENPRLRRFAAEVLRGRLRDPNWIDRNPRSLLAKLRLIKDVRASLFLRWLNLRFPEVPIVYIVRHPCAVVASHLGLGWSVEEDFASILRQEELLQDHLAEQAEWLRSVDDPVARVAAIWSVSHLVLLRQFEDTDLPLVYYEHLVRSPERLLPELFEAVGLPFDASVLDLHRQPSTTVFAGSPMHAGEDPTTAWKHRLDRGQIRTVAAVVDRFGLSDLYDPGGQPCAAPLTLPTIPI